MPSPSDDLAPVVMDAHEVRRQVTGLAGYDAIPLPTGAQAPQDVAAAQPEADQAARPGMGSGLYKFITQLPLRSVVGGIRDATQEMVTSLHELDTWAMSNSVDQFLPGPGIGKASGEAPKLPEVEKPETAGGLLVRGVAQFLTGFLPANKALQGVGLSSAVVRSLAAGAVADGTAFSPHQDRLANLIQEFPALQNPVTEFLMSKPGDSAAVGRLKNVLEGAGLGALTEGFAASLRTLRAARNARGQTGTALAPALEPKIGREAYAPLGDPKGPLTTVVDTLPDPKQARVARKVGQAAVEADPTPPGALLELPNGKGIYVNTARIREPDDVKAVIQQAADLHAGSIQEAQRGVQSNAETLKLADELGLSVGEVVSRNQGQPYNAEYAVAARKLLNASGEQLVDLARRAADANAGDVDSFNFRRAMAVHHAIQKEVIGARTETARALQSWAIPVGSGEEQSRGIKALLDAYGGDSLSKDFARRIAQAADAGALTPEGLNAMTRKGFYAAGRDAILEAWTMGLLTSPQTHLVNAMSNTLVIGQSLTERYAAGKLGAALGGEGVADGEAFAQMFGLIQGSRDILRWAAKNTRAAIDDWSFARTENLLTEPGLVMSKLEQGARAISSENFRASPDSMTGAVIDGVGALVSAPGKALNGMDAVFKTLGFQMELHAQAYRQAAREGLSGPALKERVAAIVRDPPDTVRMEAVDAALYQTFQKEAGPFAHALLSARQKVPALRVILPFVKTPANILNYTFERTPIAPLMQHVRDDIAAGGARQQIALTRIGLGTTAMLTVMDLAQSGLITGGGSPNKSVTDARERQGIPKYAVKVGDRWVQYNRADPIGSIIGIAADVAEFVRHTEAGEFDEAEFGKVFAAGMAAVGSNLLNKTYLSGTAGLVEAISDPKSKMESELRMFAGSVVPAGVAAVERAVDPNIRATYDMLDALKARTPGWSKDLPPVRDVWGAERTMESGLGWGYDLLSPLPSRREKHSPIDKEIERLGMPLDMPSKTLTEFGVSVDLRRYPHLYDRLVVLAGNEMKGASGLGAKDYLDALVSGKVTASSGYQRASDGPDGIKARTIQSVITSYREGAKAQLLKESPEIVAELRRKAERQRMQNAQKPGGGP